MSEGGRSIKEGGRKEEGSWLKGGGQLLAEKVGGRTARRTPSGRKIAQKLAREAEDNAQIIAD